MMYWSGIIHGTITTNDNKLDKIYYGLALY